MIVSGRVVAPYVTSVQSIQAGQVIETMVPAACVHFGLYGLAEDHCSRRTAVDGASAVKICEQVPVKATVA